MTKQEYQADERPDLTLTEKGHKSAAKYRCIRGYTLTEAARKEMHQAKKEGSK